MSENDTPTLPEVVNQAIPAPEVNVEQQAVSSSDESAVQINEASATSNSAGESPDVSANTTPQEGKSKAQERIQDLVAERNAAKEYAEFWRNKALEVLDTTKRTAGPQPVSPQVEVPRELPMPTLEQYQFDQGQYQQAMNQWLDNQVTARTHKALEATKQRQSQQELIEAYENRVEEFRKGHPDFDIVVANPKLPQLDKIAAAMVVSSPHSADLTYALAKDPSEATRIARLSPPQQALAIGRLETKLRLEQELPKQPASKPVTTNTQAQVATPKQAAPTAKQVTAAPPPPTPIPAGGSPQVSMETMDVNDWMRARSAEQRNRRRGGRVV